MAREITYKEQWTVRTAGRTAKKNKHVVPVYLLVCIHGAGFLKTISIETETKETAKRRHRIQSRF